MLFNSGQFFFFFLAVYVPYLLLNHRWQNRLLLLASYAFYAAWDWRFLSLILISTIIDYHAGIAIKEAKQGENNTKAKRWLALSIAANLGILGFFKYYNFFAQSLMDLGSAVGLTFSPLTLDIILPVGISFYTFQTLSYSIDVYRGRQKPTDHLADFALFVAFFPQLMAGPIERARRLLPQLQRSRKVTWEDISEGSWMILWGVFKKVYIADNLAPYVDWAFNQQGAVNSADVYLGIFAFSIQLYCDFSGYSDMARGLAKMLGIELSRNFKLPFWSTNPAQLWQHWHITLSNWFRDYVYGPLRDHIPNQYPRNLALIPTMALVGLWHGAAWKYIFFGTLWGAALYIYRQLQPSITKMKRNLEGYEKIVTVSGIFFTFHLWLLFLLFFIAVDISHGWRLWGYVLTDFTWNLYDLKDLYGVLFFSMPLIVMQIAQYKTGHQDVVEHLPIIFRIPIYVLILALLITKGSQHINEFIYFQF